MELHGRFPQIVDGDSMNLYPIYPPFPCSDFCSKGWGWCGCNIFCRKTFFSHFMFFSRFYGISNLFFSKNNSFSFQCFLTFYAISNIFRKIMFFLGNIEKCPFTYWLNVYIEYIQQCSNRLLTGKKNMCVSDHPTDSPFSRRPTQGFFIERLNVFFFIGDHIEKKLSKSDHFERCYEKFI